MQLMEASWKYSLELSLKVYFKSVVRGSDCQASNNYKLVFIHNMISIIVCSRSKIILNEFADNIKSTIGNVPYEIIWIDNSNNKYSIFEAYNWGVNHSKYPFLCFMHEDVLFHSFKWGDIIIQLLNKPQVGCVGIVGGYYISCNSLLWSSFGYKKGHYLQGYKENGHYKTKEVFFSYHNYGNKVVAIDGLFMCMRKQLFEKGLIKWDEKSYKGFHCYDLDICIQLIIKGFEIIVSEDILVEHKSEGKYDSHLLESAICFHKKWNSMLPIMINGFETDANIDENLYYLEQWHKSQSNAERAWHELGKRPHIFISKVLSLLKNNK